MHLILKPLMLISLSSAFHSQDPLESDGGWTDAGYYVTGCSKEWISVELVDKIEEDVEDVPGEEMEMEED